MTLLEVVIALTLIGIVSAAALPRMARMRDAINVRGAAADAEGMLSTARRVAIARGIRTSVLIDQTTGVLTLLAGTDTLQRRDEGSLHGVTLSSSRPATTYSPIGAGVGASNLTLIVTKGSAADTLTISRLGRVKR